MNDIKKTFFIDKSFKNLMLICAFVLVGISFLFISLPFTIDKNKSSNIENTYIIASIGLIFFFSLSVYTIKIIKNLSLCSVTIDDEGIWLSNKNKNEGLVSWNSITRIKERPALQRMDLLGRDGKLLIKIEYQLNDYNVLRQEILNRINIRDTLSLPLIFAKKLIYHITNLSCMLGFLCLGFYIGKKSFLMGYCATPIAIGFIAYEYLNTVSRLILNHSGFSIGLPLSLKHYRYEDIRDIDLSDTFHKGNRFPEIHILVNEIKQPIRIKQLGTSEAMLLATFKKVIEKSKNK